MSFFQSEEERRIFKRRPLRVTAQVLVAGKSVAVRTSDISEGGLGVVAPVSPRPGTAFRIQLTLPLGEEGEYLLDTRVSAVRSVIARDEPGFKIGLVFERLDHDAKDAIWRYIDRS